MTIPSESDFLQAEPAASKCITALAVSEDGRFLFIGNVEGAIDYWDLARNKLTRVTPELHFAAIVQLAHANNKLFSLCKNNFLRITKIEGVPEEYNVELIAMHLMPSEVRAISIGRDGEWGGILCSGNFLCYASHYFDYGEGYRMGELVSAHHPTVISFNTEKELVAFCTSSSQQNNKTAFLVLKSRNIVHGTYETLQSHSKTPLSETPSSISFSNNGEYIVLGFFTGKVGIYFVGSREARLAQYNCGRSVNLIAWSPDNRRFATGGHGSNIVVWDVYCLYEPPLIIQNAHVPTAVTGIVWNHREHLTSSCEDGHIRFWNLPLTV